MLSRLAILKLPIRLRPQGFTPHDVVVYDTRLFYDKAPLPRRVDAFQGRVTQYLLQAKY